MFIKTLLPVFIACSVFSLAAQELSFAKYYDGTATIQFARSASAPSGNRVFIDGHYVTKIDNAGNILWEKVLYEDPLIVLKSISWEYSAFSVTGYDFNTSRLFFMKLNEDGQVATHLTASSTSIPGEHFFIGRDSLVVVGRRPDSSGKETGFADLYDVATGKALWTFTCSLPNTNFTSARRINSQTLALYGSQGGTPYASACIATIDPQGREQWIVTAPSIGNSWINDAVQGPDGIIRAISAREKSSEILNITSGGQLIDRMDLPSAVGKFITKGPDGKLIIVGISRNRMFLGRLNEEGKFTWWRYYGSAAVTEFGEQIRGLEVGDDTFTFWGGTRWDSRSRPFLIRTDHEGWIPTEIPDKLIQPGRRLPLRAIPAGLESRILSADFDERDEITVGGELSVPINGQIVSAGFLAKLDSEGDTLWTRTILTPSPWGGFRDGPVSNIKTHLNEKTIIQKYGSLSDLYELSEGELSESVQVATGKRSDFAATSTGELLLCFHSFDLQPYNEVGRLVHIDLAENTVTQLPARMIGSMTHKIIATGKGTYYLAGEQIETYKVERKALFIEVNESGDVLQSHTYDLGYKTFINTMTTTASGTIVMAGAVENEQGDRDLLIVEINAQGQLLWSKTFDVLLKDEIHSLAVVPDGYLIGAEIGRPVFGLQQSFGMVALVDIRNKTLVSKKIYGNPGLYTSVVKIRPHVSAATVIGNSEHWTVDTHQPTASGFTDQIPLTGEVVGAGGGTPAPEIYPNPFTDRLIVKNGMHSTLDLIDMKGQTVRRIDSVDTDLMEINTTDLAAGVHVITMKMGSKTVVQRLVKSDGSSR